MSITMYDSVTPSAIPTDAQAVAGYVGGSFPSFSPIVARCPHALSKSIAVNSGEDADILDVEAGDATPSEAPAWLKRQHARGLDAPGVYTNASTFPQVLAACNAAGVARSTYVAWIADQNGVPHIDSQGEACQYTGSALHPSMDVDVSLCDSDFWGSKSVPADNTAFIKDHYGWFPKTRFIGWKLGERGLVMAYDKYRAQQTPTKHPHKARLAVIRKGLKLYANHVSKVAHKGKGKPSWGKFHRGWRYQQLIHRAHGARLV